VHHGADALVLGDDASDCVLTSHDFIGRPAIDPANFLFSLRRAPLAI